MHRTDEGIALIVTLLAVVAVSVLAAAIALTASTEVRIAANFADAIVAASAAESAVDRALVDLPPVRDWTATIMGPALSTFTDGPPSGVRRLADGSPLDLGAVENMANCQKHTACSAADLAAITEQRPWGANNPRWRLFAYGALSSVQPAGVVDSPFYVVALVGDDPGETDADPLRDGVPGAPGAGVIAIRGEAFGPRGAHAIAEAAAASATDAAGNPLPALRILTWRSNP